VALGVVLLFDDRAERSLLALWDRLEAIGVPTLATLTHRRHVPHLTYSLLAPGAEAGTVLAALAGLPNHGAAPVPLQGLGTFPGGIAWLAPAAPPDLAVRQAAVDAGLRARGLAVHAHYAPGTWVPHCTVSTQTRLEHLPALTDACHAVLPLPATASRAALIDTGTGRRWPLPGVP
jgi:2'-5' RNA ligase